MMISSSNLGIVLSPVEDDAVLILVLHLLLLENITKDTLNMGRQGTLHTSILPGHTQVSQRRSFLLLHSLVLSI